MYHSKESVHFKVKNRKKLKEKPIYTIRKEDLLSIHCFAHRFNLITKFLILSKPLYRYIDKWMTDLIQEVYTHFNLSPLAKEDFMLLTFGEEE